MTLHLMKNFLSCTLSALFSLTVISAQDLGPVALLEIDFWINGINTIEDRTIKTFEKTAEREELITAKLYKEIGIVLQQKQIGLIVFADCDLRHNAPPDVKMIYMYYIEKSQKVQYLFGKILSGSVR